jgi:hypothetical protein
LTATFLRKRNHNSALTNPLGLAREVLMVKSINHWEKKKSEKWQCNDVRVCIPNSTNEEIFINVGVASFGRKTLSSKLIS